LTGFAWCSAAADASVLNPKTPMSAAKSAIDIRHLAWVGPRDR
jgi:hypothetical protein